MPAEAAVAFKEQIKQKAAVAQAAGAQGQEVLRQKLLLQAPQIQVAVVEEDAKRLTTAQQAAPAL
jgi:hypothetical protein